jgi:hypothetical protein
MWRLEAELSNSSRWMIRQPNQFMDQSGAQISPNCRTTIFEKALNQRCSFRKHLTNQTKSLLDERSLPRPTARALLHYAVSLAVSEWDVRTRRYAVVGGVWFGRRWRFLDKLRHNDSDEPTDVRAEKAKVAHGPLTCRTHSSVICSTAARAGQFGTAYAIDIGWPK